MTAAPVGVIGQVLKIRIQDITPNPRNPRKDLGDLSELVASIFARGILSPLLVCRTADGWLLLAGHRRLAAAKESGMLSVPCIQVRSEDAAGQAAIMLAENVARTALDPIDEANAYRQLQRSGLSQEQIASVTGVRVERVKQRTLLLSLPSEAQRMVSAGELTRGDAVTLARQVKRQARGEISTAQCPAWLTKTHPLADDAAHRCDNAGHPKRGRVSTVACGECWESAIRSSERRVALGAA